MGEVDCLLIIPVHFGDFVINGPSFHLTAHAHALLGVDQRPNLLLLLNHVLRQEYLVE